MTFALRGADFAEVVHPAGLAAAAAAEWAVEVGAAGRALAAGVAAPWADTRWAPRTPLTLTPDRAVEVGHAGAPLAAGVAAPWADTRWAPHADRGAVMA